MTKNIQLEDTAWLAPVVVEKFNRAVAKRADTETCWLWAGPINNGYGYVHHAGTNRSVLRIAYALGRPEDPLIKGWHVVHISAACRDHCVNPHHLRQVAPGGRSLPLVNAMRAELEKPLTPDEEAYADRVADLIREAAIKMDLSDTTIMRVIAARLRARDLPKRKNTRRLGALKKAV